MKPNITQRTFNTKKAHWSQRHCMIGSESVWDVEAAVSTCYWLRPTGSFRSSSRRRNLAKLVRQLPRHHVILLMVLHIIIQGEIPLFYCSTHFPPSASTTYKSCIGERHQSLPESSSSSSVCWLQRLNVSSRNRNLLKTLNISASLQL